MEKKVLSQLEEKLRQEKSTLEQELESFATKDKNVKDNWDVKHASAEDTDMEEKADEMEEYDNLLSLEHSLELKLKEVNEALEKIKHGGYGTCEKCGKEIELERLEAYPEAKLCIGCNENK
ncbi:MAG: hypothetical protein A3D44_00110 [Candidatus Staskawiczbacteria bacterium RIFCSPHIGHO2_02_FULL_42_22]|uniref:Zinc finger DksA/TraR C4-type domain-containing protein n=1 Tax=Candidatus Staskawiczbacteria bacterium RIFCSPHIGHO2_02_FULL_42_22 TaxID=1802207 RepID=A0A1G2I0D7_9BACT|nr:MAG: hypothetical protein A3D44_00110 [Candidatus Staskawiczbacteria bacterium RIFCSPHIGHO2_02_FULL_42_22]